MKTFRTVLPTQPSAVTITHADRLLLLGSCFTEHIGARLAAGRFQVLVNPDGIVYNPVSIADTLEALSADDPVAGVEVFEYHGLWHSWAHHGHFSNPDRETALNAIRAARQTAAGFLRQSKRLLLTLGTARVFSLREAGRIVANCHKAPAARFEERRLSVAETVAALAPVLEKLRTRQPELEVLLTVSPVRHLRDGFVENQRSKAVLVLACAELEAQFGFVHYFPAYELLLDDLRDYRFYAADMVHPDEAAVEYIWEAFASTYFPPATRDCLTQINKITAAARHRPFHPGTEQHRAFVQQQLERIEQLTAAYPGLDFSAEKGHFEQYV